MQEHAAQQQVRPFQRILCDEWVQRWRCHSRTRGFAKVFFAFILSVAFRPICIDFVSADKAELRLRADASLQVRKWPLVLAVEQTSLLQLHSFSPSSEWKLVFTDFTVSKSRYSANLDSKETKQWLEPVKHGEHIFCCSLVGGEYVQCCDWLSCFRLLRTLRRYSLLQEAF